MIKISTVFWMYYISVLFPGIQSNEVADQKVGNKSCKTERVVMNINQREVFGSKFEPSKYTVNRCWGDCRTKTICKAINIRKFNFTIIEYKINDDNSKGGILGRTTQDAEHHECGCVINNDGLRAKERCEKKWCHRRVWDDVNYKCVCEKTLTCTMNTYYDKKRCKCHPLDEKNIDVQLKECGQKPGTGIPVTVDATEASPPKPDYVALSDCVPLRTIVPTKSYTEDDSSQNMKYEPSEILLDRCAGSCRNKQLRNYCHVDKTTYKTISVRAFQYSFDDDEYKFTKNLNINVTAHSECSCGCTNSPTRNICNKAQKYNSKNCGCDCANPDVKELCLYDTEWSQNHVWNEDTCDCICSNPDTCMDDKDPGWQNK